MTTDYQQLINKLDTFIKQYYKNQIVKGVFIVLMIYVLYYTAIALLEYYGHFSVQIRTFIAYFSLLLAGFTLLWYIFIPLLKYLNIGKVISHRQAASIISRHFAHVQDRLLNTLELASTASPKERTYGLVMASIDQKIKDIKPLPFTAAIDKKETWRIARYFLAAAFLFVLLYFLSPAVFTESSQRLANYKTHYEALAPFSFVLVNDSLSVRKGGDLKLKLEVRGEYVPNEVYIEYGGNAFLLDKSTKSEFEYNFKNINNSIEFNFRADGYSSKDYGITVLPAPVILNFSLLVDVPSYTGEDDRRLSNIGDITIPEGTHLKWNFETKDIDSLFFTFNDSVRIEAVNDSSGFSYSQRQFRSASYTISVVNQYFENNDIVNYSISVVPDLYPTVDVRALQDSASRSVFYFNGSTSDDYGFKRLTFNYYDEENPGNIETINLKLNPNVTTYEFYYAFDFSTVVNASGKSLKYYFEVWDNDAVNGSKSARTAEYSYNLPSRQEVAERSEEKNQNVQNKITQSLQLVDEIKRDINKLQQDMINENITPWERTNMLNNIVQKQQQLEQLTEEIAEENRDKNDLMNQMDEQSEELLEKQRQIEELLDNLLTDEMKELMEQIQKLQEEFDQKEFNNMLEDIEFSYDDMEEQLDRNFELLKRFEVEQQVENTVNRLNELAEKQEELSEQTRNKEMTDEELQQEQNEQQQEFDEIMEEYEKALQENDSLQYPFDLQDFDEMQDQISQEMQEGQENLEKSKNKKASENQQNSSQKMQQMAQQMQDMMAGNMQQQNAENMNDLRQILDNLVRFSFDQEELMNNFREVSRTDPKYVEYGTVQKELHDNFEVINDSLVALAKRTPQIGSYVDKGVTEVYKNLTEAEKAIQQRYTSQVITRQQFVMKGANDLALLLSEVLESMQNQMAMGSGGGTPQQQQQQQQGGQEGSIPDIQNMQQQQQSLKQMLEQMLQQMQQGQGMGQGEMNQRLAEMMARQQMFNQMLRDLMNTGGLHPQTMQQLQDVQQMVDRLERDIVNRNITPQTLMRQQQIMTRLLEAENSERERELDEKRESEEARENKLSNPQQMFENQQDKDVFKENLNLTPLRMYNYYKEKYRSYMINLNQ